MAYSNNGISGICKNGCTSNEQLCGIMSKAVGEVHSGRIKGKASTEGILSINSGTEDTKS